MKSIYVMLDVITETQQHHGTRLERLAQQLDHHGIQLRDHGAQLRDHGIQLRDHGAQLQRMDAKLDTIVRLLRNGGTA